YRRNNASADGVLTHCFSNYRDMRWVSDGAFKVLPITLPYCLGIHFPNRRARQNVEIYGFWGFDTADFFATQRDKLIFATIATRLELDYSFDCFAPFFVRDTNNGTVLYCGVTEQYLL